MNTGELCGLGSVVLTPTSKTDPANAVTLSFRNNSPVLGHPVPYTISNVLLTLAGLAAVLIT